MRRVVSEKKEENIAEYLLYLWQMEDLLRAVDFDIAKLDDRLLSELDEKQRLENKQWFSTFAAEMRSEKVEVSGHHHTTDEVLNELMLLQQALLTTIDDKEFKKGYADAKPLLDEFKLKTDKTPRSDIETALTAIYGVLTLKLAKKSISPETRAAVNIFSAYIRMLTRNYHLVKAGKLPLNN